MLLLLLISLALAELNQVVTMPGYIGPNVHLKTGYASFSTTEQPDQHIFYAHTSLTANPKRVAFWFQGGPGGSSMIGLFEEMGPYNPVNNSHVEYRSINWLLDDTAYVFVDNPACVGFSYSSASDLNEGCDSSDTKSSIANHAVVKQILKDLKYTKIPFLITGESWSGVYTPMMTALLAKDPETNPNLYGAAIGNPVFLCYDPSDPVEQAVGDTWNNFNQLYWNGYVSQDDYDDWWASGCETQEHRKGKKILACFNLFNKVFQGSNTGADFDPDDRFADPCSGNGTLAFAESICPSSTPDNIDVRTANYLSQQSVASALGAKVQWNSQMNYFGYSADAGSMVPYYKTIMSAKPSAKILVYSGLTDVMTVPFSFTMPCITEVVEGIKKTGPWTPWTINAHTAGHWEQWGNFVYATVRGAGHELPLFTPLQGREMFRRFITKGDIGDDTSNKAVLGRRRRNKHPFSQSELLRKFRSEPENKDRSLY